MAESIGTFCRAEGEGEKASAGKGCRLEGNRRVEMTEWDGAALLELRRWGRVLLRAGMVREKSRGEKCLAGGS